MDRLYECGRCFNANFEERKCELEYHFDHELTEREISKIQSWVNKVINSNAKVTESYISKDFAEKLFNMYKLTYNTDNRVRIMRIGGYDARPCLGQHVESTAEIGTFKITNTTFEHGVLSINYKLN
jgi:Ser-tRNA(Ala) deacylase AlaX